MREQRSSNATKHKALLAISTDTCHGVHLAVAHRASCVRRSEMLPYIAS